MWIEIRQLSLVACALCCAHAWAIPRCELNGESVSPYNGNTTAGKSGLMRCVNDDGQVRRLEQTLREGRIVGPVVMVLADGERREYSVNERGNRDGLARTFDGKGTLRKEENLEDGSAVGVQKSFAEAGHLQALHFAAGRRTVLTIAWLADGSLTELRCAAVTLVPQDREVCGHAGRASDVTLYREAGQPAGTVSYLKGQLQRLTVLDREGRLVRTEELREGRRIKRVFYPSGKPRSEADFIERDPNSREGREGVAREWAESGQLTQETSWADGHEQRIHQWYLNGKQKLRQQIRRDGRNQERTTESFWDNGLPAAVNNERNGHLQGWQKYFTEAGVLAREDEHGERGVLLRRKHYGAQGVFEREERFLEDGSRI
ncbi:toxin-antitoxin system YwqK family antitoxin [Hydrogenophaga sp.]|uniref:toxin-antitoxin system YwqK family antitoxin n=1 Tax=Hydrogenophaga sp. TaxID=1904254 RepID=UPI002FC772D9